MKPTLSATHISAIAAALVILAGGWLVYDYTAVKKYPGRACTMEAKLCPDGSAVGRTGPNCEFGVCPSPSDGKRCEGQTEGTCPLGYKCIRTCGPPVVREGDAPAPFYCATNEVASKPRMCPICLGLGTPIATPAGDVQVQDLRVGMAVWSRSASGERVIAPIIAVSHVAVPATHQMVHLLLSDGREAFASPGHPLTNGFDVTTLHSGDLYDGAEVVLAELVPYNADNTYDLLPGSDTGIYFANGIPLHSTLQQ